MRILLASISALALLSTAVRAQGEEVVSYDIDFNPLTSFSAWEPPAHASGAEKLLRTFRLRMHGYEGGWARPVMSFVPAPDSTYDYEGFSWIEQGFISKWGGTQGSGQQQVEGLIMPPNPGHQPVVIAPSSANTFVPSAKGLQRWLTFGTQFGGPSLVLDGVKTWMQPFTSTIPSPGVIAPTTRVWTSDPDLWRLTVAQGGVASPAANIHRTIWQGILDEDGEASTFNAYKALRWSVIEHALYSGVSLQAVNDLFESQVWTDVLNFGHLHLGIQLVAARAEFLTTLEYPSIPEFLDDTEVPDLTDYTPSPRVSISESTQFVVRLEGELLGSEPEFGSDVFEPGTWIRFVLATGRGATWLSFEDTAGNDVVIQAQSASSLNSPAGYKAFIPSGLPIAPSSAIRMKTGNMTAFEWVGQVPVQ